MSRVKRNLVAVVTVAVAAALLAMPQLAMAKRSTYSGPISQAPLAPGAGGIKNISPPTIEFKVIDTGKQQVWKLRETSVYFHCSDGEVRYPADGGSLIPKLTFEDSIRVKKGKFSAVNDDGLGRKFTATGQLPAKGQAKGTIRITEHVDAYSDPVEGHPAYDCDTGTLNWKATRSG